MFSWSLKTGLPDASLRTTWRPSRFSAAKSACRAWGGAGQGGDGGVAPTRLKACRPCDRPCDRPCNDRPRCRRRAAHLHLLACRSLLKTAWAARTWLAVGTAWTARYAMINGRASVAEQWPRLVCWSRIALAARRLLINARASFADQWPRLICASFADQWLWDPAIGNLLDYLRPPSHTMGPSHRQLT